MLTLGLLLFPRLTQLDLTAPYEVFTKIPNSRTLLISPTLAPVVADTGLTLLPTATYADTPQLDVICAPGGIGVNALMQDAATLSFLRRQSAGARYITSVCTGALV